MTTIVVHSFIRDSGKTNLTARLASMCAAEGWRVGVVEADISLPELHTRFRLEAGGAGLTLNDFLLGRCALADAAVDLGVQGDLALAGSLVFVPASVNHADISAVLQQSIDVTALNASFAALAADYELDLLFVNAPAGLDELSLSCIALADILIVSLRLDKEDTHGTSVTLDLAHRLNVPEILLAVSRVPDEYDRAEVRREVEAAYGCEAPIVLTATDETEMMFASQASVLDRTASPLSPLLKAIYAKV